MKSWVVSAMSVAAVVACPLFVSAQEQAPDMKGKWTGKTHSIVAGSGAHWPTSKGTFEKPALVEKDLVLEITGQEGHRFWGITTVSGDGEKTDEPFIGQVIQIGANTTVIIADTDGYISGQIVNNVFYFCYAHAGSKTQSSVVSCTQVQRAP